MSQPPPAATQPHRERILYADLLRVVAILAVVFLHVSSGVAGQFGSIRLDWWWVGNVIDSLSRWSVPVFIMISGMLLLGHSRDVSIGEFLRKRFLRVFVPYAVWALLIYAPWKTLTHQEPFSWTATASEFLRGSTYYHLWFIYTIMNIYLIAPVVRVFTQNASNERLLYYLGLWFVVVTLTTLSQKFLNWTLGLSVELANGFVGFFVLGYFFDKVDTPLRLRRIIYILAAFSAVMTILATYDLSQAKGSLDDFFYAYVIPTTLVISAAVFLAFRHTDWSHVFRSQASLKLLGALSAASFGIYFVHPIVLWLLTNGVLGVTVSMTAFDFPLIGIPLTSLVTFGLSFAIVWVVRLIPIARYIVP